MRVYPAWIRITIELVLVILGLLYIYPFIWMVASSLKTPEEFFGSGLGLYFKAPVWGNYVEAWNEARFSRYLGNTVFVSVTSLIIICLFTSMAGYALARDRFPGRRLLIGTMLSMLFLPKGYTIIPIVEIARNLQLINTLWGIIVVNASASMLFNTLLFWGYFTTIPRDVEEAAMIDGANFPMIYLKVALPIARPMIAVVALFEFIESWNSFFIPLVFTLGRPDLRTLPVGIYALVGESFTNWTLISAAATMSLLPTIILFLLLQRFFIEDIASTIRG